MIIRNSANQVDPKAPADAVGRVSLLDDSSQFHQLLTDGIDALPSGFAIFDAQDRAILINKVYREMLPEGAAMLDAGANFSDMARQNAETHFGVSGDAMDAWMEKRLAYRDSPAGFFDQQLSDGRWFRIQESRTSEGGTITNWTDISDLKAQEKAAAENAVALKATNQQLDEFARAASHDLQEPLRKIEVFAGRLSDKCSDRLGDDGGRYLDRMLDATQRMKRLITALLDFSRSTDQQISFEKVDMNAVVDEALKGLELTIESCDAKIDVAALPHVQGDFDQLSRLFSNLISNALKYVAPGTQPHISISHALKDSKTDQIAIRDNGIGFDEKDAEKIFEPFQRLHGRNAGYEGTGIGLASCRRIVTQHNGTIHAEGTPGEGSTFVISLPIVKAAVAG